MQLVLSGKHFISVIKSRFVNAVQRFGFPSSLSFRHYCTFVFIDMLLLPERQMAKRGKLQGKMLS